MSIGCTGGQAWLLRSVHMSRVARPVRKTSLCKHTLQANLCPFLFPIRALVVTGASHSYTKQAFLDNQLSH